MYKVLWLLEEMNGNLAGSWLTWPDHNSIESVQNELIQPSIWSVERTGPAHYWTPLLLLKNCQWLLHLKTGSKCSCHFLQEGGGKKREVGGLAGMQRQHRTRRTRVEVLSLTHWTINSYITCVTRRVRYFIKWLLGINTAEGHSLVENRTEY